MIAAKAIYSFTGEQGSELVATTEGEDQVDDGARSEVVVLRGLVVGHGLTTEDEALLGRGNALLGSFDQNEGKE